MWFDEESITKLLKKEKLRIIEIRGSFYLPPFFDGKHYLLPALKSISKFYDPIENMLSRKIPSHGYHLIICAKKER